MLLDLKTKWLLLQQRSHHILRKTQQRIPSNIYCAGLPDVKKPPTQLADAFSMRVEVVDQLSYDKGQEFVSTVKQWYDYNRKLTRSDAIPNPDDEAAAIAGFNELAIIQDFKAGVEYIIDKALGNCTTMLIPDNSYDAIVDPSGKVNIKNPLDLFGLGKVTNLTYYGKKNARDLPCDVWIGHLNLELENKTLTDSLVYVIYFLESGWHEDGGPVDPFVDQYPEPVLVKIQQDLSFKGDPLSSVEIEENIFKYDDEPPEMTVFDITPCFSGHDHIRRFQIAFPGKFRDDFDHNPSTFTKQVHDSMAEDLRIPVIRIQHLLIEFNENDGELYAEFTLVDRPEVEGIDFPESVGPPLEDLVTTLQEEMSNFLILIYDPSYDTPGHVKKMVAYPDSLQEMFEDECTPMISLSLPHQRQYSSTHKRSKNPHLASLAKQVKSDDNYLKAEDQTQVKLMEATPVDLLDEKFIAKAIDDITGSYHGALNQVTVDGRTKSFSSGAMAGMGIGMFLLGAFLGMMIVLASLKKLPLPEKIELITIIKKSKSSDC